MDMMTYCEGMPGAFSPRTKFIYYGTRYEPARFHTFPGNVGPDTGGLSTTGENLFTFDGSSVPHGGGAQAAPVAYVVRGKEFVVNAFGGNVPDRQFAPNPVG